MTRIKRRIIFYLLVAVFLLGAPATILYALGYSYDWQNNRITQTGGIYLKSAPSGARIFLDGKNVAATNSLLSRLAPGDYGIRISKDGYRDWKKALPVYPQLVTEARNIFLFPQKITADFFAVGATSSIPDFLMDAKEKGLREIAAQTASTTAGWLFDGQNLYFINRENYILYESRADGSDKNQISAGALPKNINYQIISDDDNFLALDQNGALYLLDKQNNNFSKISLNARGAELSGDHKKFLYFSDNEIYVYFLDDILIQPYKTRGDTELITRQSEKITQAVFYPNNEYIAYVSGDKIKDVELDDRDVRNIVDLISATAPEIYFDRANDYFYYKTGDNLYRFKLE